MVYLHINYLLIFMILWDGCNPCYVMVNDVDIPETCACMREQCGTALIRTLLGCPE